MFEKLRALTRPTPAPAGPVEYLVVGLGNPGREYENTRHNVGFMALDTIAAKAGVSVDRIKFKGLCGDGMVGGKRVLFLKPSTFMNLSGQSVTEAMQFYKIPPERVIVFCDDITLEPGRVRIRRKGSDGGHNGLKNIIYLMAKDTFPRVRIGVGQKPHPDYDLARWVLGRFSPEDSKKLQTVLDETPEILRLLVEGKIDQAMNQYNR